jgi:hypothetical protein
MANVMSAYPWQKSTTTADSGVGAYTPNNTAQMQLAALMAAEANATRARTTGASSGGAGAASVHIPDQPASVPAPTRAMPQTYRRPVWLVPQHGYGGGGAYIRSEQRTPYSVFGGYEETVVDPNTGITTDHVGGK